MKALFKKEEIEQLSVSFILSIPAEQDEDAAVLYENKLLKDEQCHHSWYHQNKKKKIAGGFYKSITRIIE